MHLKYFFLSWISLVDNESSQDSFSCFFCTGCSQSPNTSPIGYNSKAVMFDHVCFPIYPILKFPQRGWSEFKVKYEWLYPLTIFSIALKSMLLAVTHSTGLSWYDIIRSGVLSVGNHRNLCIQERLFASRGLEMCSIRPKSYSCLVESSVRQSPWPQTRSCPIS